MTRPKDLVYAVDEVPPPIKLGALGLQLVSVLAIYLVLVVIVVREAGASEEAAQQAVSLGMIALGAGAVFQGLWRGPVGSGYLAPPVLSAVYLHSSIVAAKIGGLPLVCGMTIVAGGFEAILSRLLLRFRRYFPPVVSGLIVLAVGIELGLVGAEKLLVVEPGVSAEYFRVHLAIATLTVSVMVGLSVWGKGMFRLLCTLIGILVGLIAAIAAGHINHADVARIWAAPIFAIPSLSHISYSIHLSLVVPFLFAGLAAGLRVIGVIMTCQRLNDADWKRPEMKSIKGGVLADGIGCAVSGLIGGIGMSAAPSAVGISKATGATSRYIALAIGFWFAAFACFPKVSAIFLALPISVVGAGLVFTGSFMIVGGMNIITMQAIDIRKTFIIGISLPLALTQKVLPHYFATFPSWAQPMTGSLLTIATASGILLNLLFTIGMRRRESISVKLDETSLQEVTSMIQKSGKKWGSRADMTQRVAAMAAEVFGLLQERALADGPVTFSASFDEYSFVLDVTYKGTLLHLPPDRPLPHDLVEELPFSIGLSGFLQDIYPDRVESKAKDSVCSVRLEFQY